MLERSRFLISVFTVACITLFSLKEAQAESLLIEENGNSRLVFGRYSTQQEVEELKLRSDIYSIDLQETNINPLPLFKQTMPTVKELYASNIPFLEQILQLTPKNLPSLEVLVLANSGITSSSLSSLGQITGLKVLDLSQTFITDRKDLDKLLEQNPNLIIYIESLAEGIFPCIDMNMYKDHPRVIRKKYGISPYPVNASIVYQYKKV